MLCVVGSVADPFHFETAPDPTKKKPTFLIPFFLLITKRIIYYYINIENVYLNEKKNLKYDLSLCTVCPRSSAPILYGKLLYKMGHYFLDIQYVSVRLIFFYSEGNLPNA